MISLGVVPWVEFILFFLIKSIRRYRDSGSIFSHHNHKTKCCTQKQYVDLYGGGDFQIHFRYASIMTMVFLSFMYGMAIPILFPVTLFGITSIYVNERVLLAYSYKKPPPLDEDLELRSYKFLKFAPLLMFLIGYWSLSNQQVFYNVVSERKYSWTEPDPQHGILPKELDATLILFVMVIYLTLDVLYI